MRSTRYDKVTEEKKSYIWLATEHYPKFYTILVSKNQAYELLLQYFKIDKNLTVD